MVSLWLCCTGVWGGEIYVPDDYQTIQAAIDASSDGDFVIVRAGTYYGSIDFLDRNITLQSEKGPEATFIDGVQSGSTVTFRNAGIQDAVLEGFTIFNGTGTYRASHNW